MEYSFLFPLMQTLLKSIKKCKTYSRKATGLFSGHGVDVLRVITRHVNKTVTVPSENLYASNTLKTAVLIRLGWSLLQHY